MASPVSAASDTSLSAAPAALEREASARLVAEQRLVEREQQMDLIEQLTATGSWEYDMVSNRIVWSREQLRIHGLPLDQPERTESDFLNLLHPDDRQRVVDVMSRLIETGEPFYVEYRIVRPDGQERLLQAPGRLVPGPDGRLTRMIGTSLDITERRATEMALRRSEESYRTIFRHASDAMWLHDVDTGAFIEVNEAACEVFGYTAQETKAMGVGGLSAGVPPFTLQDAMRYVQRAAAGEPQRFEWLGPHKDGRDVWLEMRLRRVTIDGIDRILATGRDINELKAAEAALRAANEALEQRVSDRTAELAASNAALAQEVAEHAHAKDALLARTRELEGIFQALPDLYFRIDADQRVIDYRAGNGGGLYLSAEKSLGKRLRDALPADICDRMDEALAAAAPGELATVEYLLPLGNEVRDHEARFFPLGDGTRIALVRDITERKEAERALRDREVHFRRLIENTSDFVMIVDDTAKITYVGPSATRMLGWETDRLMGSTPSDLVHPDDQAHVMQDFAWIIQHPGEPYTSTFRIRHKDGSYRVFENLGRTLSPNSPAEGVVAFGRDVTERKVAEASLARAKEEAERANEQHPRLRAAAVARRAHAAAQQVDSAHSQGGSSPVAPHQRSARDRAHRGGTRKLLTRASSTRACAA
jgi:PAS domain S-box-containing protein